MSDKGSNRRGPFVAERDDRLDRHEERDEKPDYQRRTARDEHSSGSRGGSQTGGGVKLMITVLLLALLGLGGFAWQQSRAQTALTGRFDELAAKIEFTDESLNQSGTALSVQIKAHSEQLDKQWAEIKKLWVVANERNRKAISDLQATAEKQGQAAKKLEQSIAAQKIKVEQALATVSDVSSGSLALTAQIEELQNRLQAGLNKIVALEKSSQQLQTTLQSRVANNEEAIRSIDAFRRQTNQQLEEIRRGMAVQ